MKFNKKILLYISIFPLSFFLCSSGKAQNTFMIEGIVKDSLTLLPLNSVVVKITDEYHACLSNSSGYFRLPSRKPEITVTFSVIGYEAKKLVVNLSENNVIEVLLAPKAIQLNEVVARFERKKYSKKDNPAVELIKKVIEHKNDFLPKRHDYYQFEEYERKSLAITDFTEDTNIKGFEFLHQYTDTSKINQTPILWLSVKEKVSDRYYRKNPETKKEIVKGIHRTGIDSSFNQEGIDNVLNEVFSNIDIFENDITYLMNRFVSPLSSYMAVSFYKFYIADTVTIDNKPYIDLEFVPFNTRDFGFAGHLFIADDSTYAVKKVQLSLPKEINLNYVSELLVEQEFEQKPNNTRVLSKESMAVDFRVVRSLHGFYAEITKHYSGYMFDTPRNEVYQLTDNTAVSPLADKYALWDEYRKKGIREKEAGISKMMNELRREKTFNMAELILYALTSGYIPTGRDENNKLELGPVGSLVSHNELEGWRYRLGFRTTVNTHDRWYLAAYGAYGTGDDKFKYYGNLKYSFLKRKIDINEFPMNSVGISYLSDLEVPGQNQLTVNRDNILASINRRDVSVMSHHKVLTLFYQREFANDFSFELSASRCNDTPAGRLQYLRQTDNGIVPIHDITTAGIGINLRYSPGQKFFQSSGRRYNVGLDAPVFTFSQIIGFNNLFGADHSVQATELSASKRFWFSAFGNMEILVKAGKVWNTAPFPLLFSPNANTSYFIDSESFGMMNVLEFINDQYVSLFMTYHANGLLFNRIPLIQSLKFREVVSFRGLWGDLSNKNNPAYNNNVFLFPADINGNSTSGPTRSPYMEMSFGIENILNIIRVDYLRRISRSDNPTASKHGWQIGFNFRF